MGWDEGLSTRALGEAADDHLHKYLRGLMPQFKPCTDPVEWGRRAAELRREALDKVYLRGWPEAVRSAVPRVNWGETLDPHPDYVIRKLCFEACPDYWIPALLYEPRDMAGSVPVVLNPNGHHGGGKACDYKQARCINLAKRGMLALNYEFLGMSELDGERPHDDFAFLDLAGRAGVGLFYLAMSKALDVVLAHPHADRTRVCMTGLSGGGWQTIVLSALDERVTVSVPVAGYTAARARVGCLADIGDLEQAPVDLTTVLDYQDLTAMLAPRPTLQILNENDDCCFRTDRAKPVIHDAVRPVFEALGAGDAFVYHNNVDPGTHNYESDSRSQLYRFLNRHFGLETPAADRPYADELYSEPELMVGLPPGRTTFRMMARKLGAERVAELRLPSSAGERDALRRALADTVRLPRWRGRVPAGGLPDCGTGVLRTGALRVPVTTHIVAGNKSARLLIADRGRGAYHGHEPEAGESVFAADILGTGECAGDIRHLLLVDSAGQRLLGVRAAQLLACADVIAAATGVERIDLQATGLNCGVTAAVAAALRPERFRIVTANDLPTTLLWLQDAGMGYEDCQASLCFGLLAVADIPQLRALMSGVELRQPGRCTPPHTTP